jgi:hypothetical protein
VGPSRLEGPRILAVKFPISVGHKFYVRHIVGHPRLDFTCLARTSRKVQFGGGEGFGHTVWGASVSHGGSRCTPEKVRVSPFREPTPWNRKPVAT